MPETACLRLAHLAYPVCALGPGRRLALWVAGCTLRCPGCISPELQPAGSGEEIAVARLARHMLNLPGPLDGLSLTGGEPFEQAGALAALLEIVLAARPQWDVLAFSGYPLSTLRRRVADADKLLAHCDLLIAGPYAKRRPAHHPLAASDNQRVHCLTRRGEALAETGLACKQADLARGKRGETWLIGILDARQRAELHRAWGLKNRRTGQ
jgi:anaerobic ribonucleoside-triphosphate reductase activating protein